jgi:hypothetical protein
VLVMYAYVAPASRGICVSKQGSENLHKNEGWEKKGTIPPMQLLANLESLCWDYDFNFARISPPVLVHDWVRRTRVGAVM